MQDPLWIRSLLAVHIAAGSLAFVMAPIALLTAKGGKAHRRWGRIYFWAMAVVAVSALVLSIWRPILFLALVAIFSFYSAFMAYRVLGQKDRARGADRIEWLDWGAAVFTFVASLTLAILGAIWPRLVGGLGIPAIVFGIIGMRLSGGQIWSFLNPPHEKMFWWYTHLQGMIGSYIAAWTAFSIVTIGPLVHHAWWLWIVPSAIGVPAIFWTTVHYKKKFAPRVKSAVAG